jgi:hypothetical protein
LGDCIADRDLLIGETLPDEVIVIDLRDLVEQPTTRPADDLLDRRTLIDAAGNILVIE